MFFQLPFQDFKRDKSILNKILTIAEHFYTLEHVWRGTFKTNIHDWGQFSEWYIFLQLMKTTHNTPRTKTNIDNKTMFRISSVNEIADNGISVFSQD